MRNATKDGRILVALDRDFSSNKSFISLIKKSSGVLLISSAEPNSNKLILILEKVLKNNHLKNINGKLCLASIDEVKIVK